MFLTDSQRHLPHSSGPGTVHTRGFFGCSYSGRRVVETRISATDDATIQRVLDAMGRL